jgi:hypothetical protein
VGSESQATPNYHREGAPFHIALGVNPQRLLNNICNRVPANPTLFAVTQLNPEESFFVPLLELQAAQHLAIFSQVTILASLMMCSHVPTAFRDLSAVGDSSIGIRQ